MNIRCTIISTTTSNLLPGRVHNLSYCTSTVRIYYALRFKLPLAEDARCRAIQKVVAGNPQQSLALWLSGSLALWLSVVRSTVHQNSLLCFLCSTIRRPYSMKLDAGPVSAPVHASKSHIFILLYYTVYLTVLYLPNVAGTACAVTHMAVACNASKPLHFLIWLLIIRNQH